MANTVPYVKDLTSGQSRPLAPADTLTAADGSTALAADYVGRFEQASLPTTIQVPDTKWAYWWDTVGLTLYLVRNRSGTIYSIEITSPAHTKQHALNSALNHGPGSNNTLIGTEGGVLAEKSFGQAATGLLIVQRDSNGEVLVLSTPIASNAATSKQYVDAQVAGARDPKDSCRLATAAALPAYTPSGGPGPGRTLTGNANGALTVDGVAVVTNDRVLVKSEAASHADHGIYRVSAPGDGGNPFVLIRATDADQDAEVTAGLFTWVTEGTANADSGWLLITNDPIIVDTTALQFTQVSALGQVTAGDGVDKTGSTLFAVTSVATVEQQYGGIVKDRNSAGTGAAAADEGFLALKTDNVDLAVGTSNEVKIKALSRLDHVKGQATYAGSAPIYSELNGLLPAQFDHGYFYKGATDPVFHAFRRSTSAGTTADFGIVEMT